MYLRYGLLADAVAPGAQGKKNIIGTFTTIYAPQYPCNQPGLSLAIRIEGDPSELGRHHMELSFVDADYKAVRGSVTADFDLEKEKIPVEGIPLAFEAVLNIQDLRLPNPGSYEFVVKVDGRHLGSIPLYAIKVHQPAP